MCKFESSQSYDSGAYLLDFLESSTANLKHLIVSEKFLLSRGKNKSRFCAERFSTRRKSRTEDKTSLSAVSGQPERGHVPPTWSSSVKVLFLRSIF